MTTASTADSYYLAPEWAKQRAVMLTWPHSDTIWAETLATVDPIFAEVTKEIAKREKVVIACVDQTHQDHITTLLRKANVNLDQVAQYVAPSNDVWVRDHGPITVYHDGTPLLLDFTFNGWGNKYPAQHDNLITASLHAQQAFGDTPLATIDMVLEGGAVEVDGKGSLMTTSRCLLAKTRNPSLSQKDIADRLHHLFGIKRILWLDEGYLAGDDTDGHIDTLARFTDAHTICYVTCDDPSDEHFEALKKMEAQLRSFVDDQGNPYRLVPLPWPKARYADYDGRRLPLTYANFLIINDAVLAPIYDDVADKEALRILAACFPDREIIPIPSLAIAQWYGSIHCMTMQLPQEVNV
jgi:agmatine deiminase